MKRWPVIRHIRYWYLGWKVYSHAARWGAMGIGFGVPNPSDIEHLTAIWESRA